LTEIEVYNTEDSLLLRQLAEGSRPAFDSLYYKYQPKLQLYLLPFMQHNPGELREIIQDVFVKVWLKKETFAAIESFEYYLYRMSRNRLLDIYRSRKSREKNESLYLAQAADSTDQLADELAFREYHRVARQAIDLLPDRRRMIFDLMTEQDLSAGEVASMMGLSIAVIKKQLFFANQFIRDYIRQHGDISLLIILFSKIF